MLNKVLMKFFFVFRCFALRLRLAFDLRKRNKLFAECNPRKSKPERATTTLKFSKPARAYIISFEFHVSNRRKEGREEKRAGVKMLMKNSPNISSRHKSL